MSDLILSVKNVSVWLKSDKTQILNNVSFDLHAGDVMAIDGLNGSGKSTLLKMICCETSDYTYEGEIVYYPFSNIDVLSLDEKEVLKYHSLIGYVPQKDNYEGINKINIQDLIIDACKASGMDVNKGIELFEEYFKESEHIKLKSIPGKLSGGEQRMISIFLGLVCKEKSKLMIIDEPLNNLDFKNAMKVSDLINRIKLENKDSALLIITHCKVITCIKRQRRLVKGIMEQDDSKYECHHCMGEPDCNLYYKKGNE